jgi:glycosyltransferase involved in cell wall biosynthesis
MDEGESPAARLYRGVSRGMEARVMCARVLYISYWGALEPLGQSLLVPAVRRLADLGARLTLLTFEKPADLARSADRERTQTLLERHGVRWVPLLYHKRPRVPATAFDVLQGCARAVLARLTEPFDLVHARTFIGGLIGLTVAPLLGAKLIYHNEGFYPDEQVDGGVWRNGSLPHRVAQALEQRLYARADAIVALSHQARRILEALPAVRRRHSPVIVVPSCVDLDHFRPPTKATAMGDELRLAYIGSIGGRYLFKEAARFAAICRETRPVHLRVLTRTTPDVALPALHASGLPEAAWSLVEAPHSAVPRQLTCQDAGLAFLRQGISEHGGSPTKVGEYWAMGLPVVSTPNSGDTEEIIRRERVGVVVREHTDAEYRRAALELHGLLRELGLRDRCRRAAEQHYALGPACERQTELYRSLLAPRRLTVHAARA